MTTNGSRSTTENSTSQDNARAVKTMKKALKDSQVNSKVLELGLMHPKNPKQFYMRRLKEAATCRRWEKAWGFFQKLQNILDHSDEPLSTELYHVGINAAVMTKKPRQVFALFREMVEEGRKPHAYMCERAANCLWHAGKQYRPSSSSSSSNKVKGADNSRKQNWSRLVLLVDIMHRIDTIPSRKTFNQALEACLKLSQWEKTLKFYARMEQAEIVPSERAYRAAITACVQTHNCDRALQIFERVKLDAEPPTENICMEVMIVCLNTKRWHEAVELLQYMRSRGMEVSSLMYATAAETCSRAEQYVVALQTLASMQEDGVVPCNMANLSLNSVLGALHHSQEYDSSVILTEHIPDIPPLPPQ